VDDRDPVVVWDQLQHKHYYRHHHHHSHGKHQEKKKQRPLSMQMDRDMEMDARSRSQAQRSHRGQSDGAAFLSGDHMREERDRDGDDNRENSPEEYVMPTRPNVGDQLPQRTSSSPSFSSARQQEPFDSTID